MGDLLGSPRAVRLTGEFHSSKGGCGHQQPACGGRKVGVLGLQPGNGAMVFRARRDQDGRNPAIGGEKRGRVVGVGKGNGKLKEKRRKRRRAEGFDVRCGGRRTSTTGAAGGRLFRASGRLSGRAAGILERKSQGASSHFEIAASSSRESSSHLFSCEPPPHLQALHIPCEEKRRRDRLEREREIEEERNRLWAGSAATDRSRELGLSSWPDQNILGADIIQDDVCTYAEIRTRIPDTISWDYHFEHTGNVPVTFTIRSAVLKEAIDDLEWPSSAVQIRIQPDPPSVTFRAEGHGDLLKCGQHEVGKQTLWSPKDRGHCDQGTMVPGR
ncbi:hypothetical protein KSP40_PGU000060 [Platanthera guangdongensis]|uniref:CS domain-containing protein n=1 Tax=Platanthera guangdongensis TaxID=2320717 RepID=A0ABR2LYF7_9ASPA